MQYRSEFTQQSRPQNPNMQGSQHTQSNQDYFLETMRAMQNCQMEILREIHRLSMVRIPPAAYPTQQHQNQTIGTSQPVPPTASNINQMYTWPNSGQERHIPGVIHANPGTMAQMPLTN